MDAQGVYLPLDAVLKFHGLALDIGGTAIKILYLPKEEWDKIQAAEQKPPVAKLGVKILSTTRIADAAKFIEEECAIIRKEGEKPLIHATGITTTQFAARIKKRLDCELRILNEEDCFVNAFKYLLPRVPRGEFVIPANQEIVAQVLAESQQQIQLLKTMSNEGVTEMGVPDLDLGEQTTTDSEQEPEMTCEADPMTSSESVLPCLLAMCGSGIGFIKVTEDKQCVFIDGIHRGGRSFVGLASLLTGSRSYDELAPLVEKGNDRNIDVYMSDLPLHGDDDIYGKARKSVDQLMLSFGKVVGKDRDAFKREDLACAVLQPVCHEIAQLTQWAALKADVRHVFFCGAFINVPRVQDVLSTWIQRRIIGCMLYGFPKFEYHFLRNGSHYGAIGAALNHVTKFLSQPEDNEEEKKVMNDDTILSQISAEKTTKEGVTEEYLGPEDDLNEAEINEPRAMTTEKNEEEDDQRRSVDSFGDDQSLRIEQTTDDQNKDNKAEETVHEIAIQGTNNAMHKAHEPEDVDAEPNADNDDTGNIELGDKVQYRKTLDDVSDEKATEHDIYTDDPPAIIVTTTSDLDEDEKESLVRGAIKMHGEQVLEQNDEQQVNDDSLGEFEDTINELDEVKANEGVEEDENNNAVLQSEINEIRRHKEPEGPEVDVSLRHSAGADVLREMKQSGHTGKPSAFQRQHSWHY